MNVLLLSISAFALAAVARAQSNDHGLDGAERAKNEILQLESARNDAIIKGDAAALEQMTVDDYTFITLRCELRTKSEIVRGFKTGSFPYDS